MTIGIWRPNTSSEISAMKHTAGLYGHGVVEIWTEEHLVALVERLNSTLVVLEQDTHAVPLGSFQHPDVPFYLVGPMNGSIPHEVRDLGRIVQVETASRYPLQPSVAAAIVLHDYYTSEIRTPA